MPITKLDTHSLSVFCANCGAERALDASEVTFDAGETGLCEALRLPPCRACSSVELLLPSSPGAPERPDQGCYGHLHQLLVNEVRNRMKHDSSDSTASTNAELMRWFPDGLVLAVPSDFSSQLAPPPKVPSP
jgi:hypothetical protein